MIHVVLCDDHAVLRRGIRDTLAEAPEIEVTAEAGNSCELREVLRSAACDVLLLSMYQEDQYALRCLKAGAQGYANKAGDPLELITAVRTVMQGRKYLTA